MTDLIGQTIGSYRIDRLLGEGGMGSVYQAYDLSLERVVAIKFIHPHLARRLDFQQRFIQEARIMARLDHPGIIRVYMLGKEGDLLFLPMEFIKGGNLRQLLDKMIQDKKWIPQNEAILLVKQLCDVVEYTHQHGVLHRDIKPANLMLKPEPTDGLPFRVILTDLGLAKLLEGLGITQEGTSLGTPAYMSPEQASGQATDRRSDVYSLGVLLYELTVGRLPFQINSITEAARYHTQIQPPSPRSLCPELSTTLEQIILKALEKDPNNRYPTAAALGTALAGLMSPATEIIDPANPGSSLVTEFQESLVASPRPEAVSIMTVLETEAVEPRGDSVFGEKSVAPAAQARIQVVEKDKTSRVVPLPSATVTIGRDKDNTIVLDDNKASRRHAQVTWDGMEYYVMDLDSTNGTYLENTKLLPGVAEVWRPNQNLRIGDAWMRLIPPKIENKKATETIRSGSKPSLQANSSAGLIGLSMTSPQLTVEAGGRVSTTITLLNQSPDVDHFSLSLKGIQKDWIESLPAVVQLMPGEQKETEFTLRIPRAPESRAGVHPLILRVNSQRDPSQFVEMKLTLTIAPYSQFQAKFQPQRLRAGRPGQLTVYNQGNSPESFNVQFKDAAEELVFQPADLNVTVPEGGSASAEYRAHARQFRLLGGEKRHSFSAQISLPKGEQQTVQAEILSYGLVPPWVPPLILLLCMALVGMAALLGTKIPNSIHASETTTALASDLDHDGLTMQQELALGCDPNNPDTDGDGLSDSEEKAWGTNCTVRDSDHDSLTDGEEVHTLKTNPMNPDTDGDGIPDNVDPAPGALPTLTPSPVPATATLMPTLMPTTAASPTPRPERIAFVSNRDGRNQIYIMNADGSNPNRLTNDNADDYGPDWSPDGKKIAFYDLSNGGRQIYIMNADGSNVTQLKTGNTFDYTPAWSPNGKKIAFSFGSNGNVDIYVINMKNGNLDRLTDNEHSDICPSWSPDGSKIVFQTYRDLQDELYVVNADGSNLVRLTNNGGNSDPQWSPDGSKILYVSYHNGNADIYVINADGGNPVQLTNDPHDDVSPAWSPDGSKIVFASNRDGNFEIYVMNADGGNQVRLTNNTVDDTEPDWSR